MRSFLLFESSTQFMQDYETAKSELEGTYNYIIERIILRSRAMWYELGEKSTLFLLLRKDRNQNLA